MLQLSSCRNNSGKGAVVLENDQFFSYVKPYLKNGYDVVMVPKGISMLPTIGDNTDLVRLHTDSIVRDSDIVLVQMKSGQYVMHRIIAISGKNITLKGDNNKTVEHVTHANVLAKMVEHRKNGASEVAAAEADSNAIYRLAPHLRLDPLADGCVVADTLYRVAYLQRVIAFNEPAKMLWEKFQGRDFSIADMAKTIISVYDIDADTANRDCTALLTTWLQCAMVQIVKE